MIAPSQRFDTIASRHIAELPPAVRTMLGGVGVSNSPQDIKGGALASYLLFEGGYTRELMALGQADAMRQRAEVCTFFGWVAPAPADQRGELPDKPVVERRLDPLRLR